MDDTDEPHPPRWHLLLPVGVIVLASVLTPASEFRTNQGDIGLYLENARRVLTGLIPYRDFGFEYPPLAVVPMVVPALFWPFGPLTLNVYPWLFAAWGAALMLTLGIIITRIVRLGGGPQISGRIGSMAIRLTILSAGTALALAWRFDLFPAVLVMVALWAALEGRPVAAGVVIGMGALAKLYPLALVPALALPWLLPLSVTRLAKFALAAALTVQLVMLQFLTLAGGDTLQFLAYHSQRGLQVESIGGGLAMLVGLIGGEPLEMSFGFRSAHVEGNFARGWLTALPLLTVAGFGLLGLLGWRRINLDRVRGSSVPARTIVAFATASVLVLLVTSKVFSIQYVVWIVPFAALLPRRQFWLAVAIVALTMPIHPLLYEGLVDQDALPIFVLNLRNALLCVLLAWVLVGLARSGSGSVSTMASTSEAQGRARARS